MVPPGPAPAPPQIISETVALTPGARSRTDIGVGEEVNLLAVGRLGNLPITVSVPWWTTNGTITPVNGPAALLTAPDTAQKITVTAGTATKEFNVIAPTSVAMEREAGTNVIHGQDTPISGLKMHVYLGPDNVNFSRVNYHELDVKPTMTGAYSCPAKRAGASHCGAGVGNPCRDIALSDTVVAGKGTDALEGDCAYSGHCGTDPPFGAGSVSLLIPYEYNVGAGPFHFFRNVPQVHILATDGSTLTVRKDGASGATTVAAPTYTLPNCPS
jgi:hypothetical protein